MIYIIIINHYIINRMTSQKDTKTCGFLNCNKKLKLCDIKCRCELTFCSIHRLPETHNCSYNFKLTQSQIKNMEENMKCVNNKIIKI
jgi:predicted nucleic acid binding AN1-type Zn finger protein